ncbi:MAG: hypothetical protein GY747_05915 [Planctomycetes bacterium]|nr:hypothetical protein [Planctomycetota bacterium]MCP4771553.1 hypothetical protein [Planctomycetota bacterium]MCP4861214.1 hypothetical protein [Planctomycetota bacterium]
MKNRHPLIETLVAVVCVGAVAVLTALPSAEKVGEKNVELHDSLSVLRTAIFRFSMDHELDDMPLMPGVVHGDITHQLVGTSRSNGSTDAPERTEDRFFGPYLDVVPRNPVNGLQTIRSMPVEYNAPVLNGSAGWVYVPSTGKVYADLPGADTRGITYLEY